MYSGNNLNCYYTLSGVYRVISQVKIAECSLPVSVLDKLISLWKSCRVTSAEKWEIKLTRMMREYEIDEKNNKN